MLGCWDVVRSGDVGRSMNNSDVSWHEGLVDSYPEWPRASDPPPGASPSHLRFVGQSSKSPTGTPQEPEGLSGTIVRLGNGVGWRHGLCGAGSKHTVA